MTFGELDTTLLPPIGFFSAQYCIRFPCFPPHVRLPQVSVGHTSGFSPSRVHGYHRRLGLDALEVTYVMRGMYGVARAS